LVLRMRLTAIIASSNKIRTGNGIKIKGRNISA